MRYAIIDPQLKEKNIINIVEWNGSAWLPPHGTYVIPCEIANVGDTYNAKTGEFTRPYIFASNLE